jgi:hypothetical protein
MEQAARGKNYDHLKHKQSNLFIKKGCLINAPFLIFQSLCYFI